MANISEKAISIFGVVILLQLYLIVNFHLVNI